MKSKIEAMLRHPWLTKKRKIMLGVLMGFAICSSVYTATNGGANIGGEDSAGPTSAGRKMGTYVQAGGWVCNDLYSAMNQRMINGAGANVASSGCSQVGSDLYVRILGRRSSNGVEYLNVGNPGGTGWVSEDDLVQN